MATPWAGAQPPTARRWWDGPGAASNPPLLQFLMGSVIAGQATFVGWWDEGNQIVQPMALQGWWDKPAQLVRAVKTGG